VARELIARWDLGEPRKRFNALLAEGRTMPGGPRVGVLMPQTYMNESGTAVGPARGALKVELDHVVVVHDEIDLPFGDVRLKLGGGLAGNNGLKSLKAGFGSAEFRRVRVGVGRPDTTDSEIVSAHVLGRWRQSREEVAALIGQAVDIVTGLVADEL
jgi:PTH1 family peptidyl-tRNA hydrolase